MIKIRGSRVYAKGSHTTLMSETSMAVVAGAELLVKSCDGKLAMEEAIDKICEISKQAYQLTQEVLNEG